MPRAGAFLRSFLLTCLPAVCPLRPVVLLFVGLSVCPSVRASLGGCGAAPAALQEGVAKVFCALCAFCLFACGILSVRSPRRPGLIESISPLQAELEKELRQLEADIRRFSNRTVLVAKGSG